MVKKEKIKNPCDECGKEMRAEHVGLAGNCICDKCASKQYTNTCRIDIHDCKTCPYLGKKDCAYLKLLIKERIKIGIKF